MPEEENKLKEKKFIKNIYGLLYIMDCDSGTKFIDLIDIGRLTTKELKTIYEILLKINTN
jgi:hypothetical protein